MPIIMYLASVKKDLFNLTKVFFDSVFHPLLTEETFKREGHHLEPADPDQPLADLKINGIVYNEVKNGLSDPEWRLHLAISGGLLPDTPYARNGAGDALVMPDLTYEQFKAYHRIPLSSEQLLRLLLREYSNHANISNF